MDVRGLEPGSGEGPLAIICGGGSLPFAVAETVARRGRPVILFALRGFADAARVAEYPHHWTAVGQYGRFRRMAEKEGVRDVVFIGSLIRPALSQVRLDLGTLRILPRVMALFRGGDNHLLSGIVRILEQDGFHVFGAHEVAPELLMPEGVLGRYAPSDRDRDDIARGLALIATIGAFDVGQAAVVADNHVLAVEAIEGTDQMLSRIAEMRQTGRIRALAGTGVLIKAPKPAQERRGEPPAARAPTIGGGGAGPVPGPPPPGCPTRCPR